ncbi:MAG: hypothetical protein LBK99_14765 [Opitutaceae bacterium]|jgi:hypothetical protein|nr:hypothetical protein [Opitutaceae bacterium]
MSDHLPIRAHATLAVMFALAAIAQPAAAAATTAPNNTVELLVNGALDAPAGKDWPDGWRRDGKPEHSRLISDPSGGKNCFEFSAPNAGAQQDVAIDPRWWKLELRFRMKTEDVAGGAADWQNARMALRFADAQWKTVTPWPPNFGLTRTNDWAEHKVTITVPESAKRLVVSPAMLGASGKVWFAGLSLRVLALLPEKGDAASPLGPDIDLWTFKDAWKTRSAMRERLSLNGYWRFFPVFNQPVEDGATAAATPAANSGWGFFKIPGYWSGDNRHEQPVILSPWIEKKLAEAKVSREAFSQAWYQRRIEIPATWTGRRVVLRLEDVQGMAEVFVGGKKAGLIGWPGGELDLTAHCEAGRTHELSLLVSGRLPPDNPYAPPSYLQRYDTPKPPTLRNRGLCGDAWLTCLPGPAQTPAQLGSILVQPSVREGRISFRVPFITAEKTPDDAALANLFLRAEIFDNNGRKVKTLVSAPGALLEGKPPADAALEGERVLTWGGAWNANEPATESAEGRGGEEPPVFWDIDNPRLYTTRIALVRRDAGADGQHDTILDETLPVRFGFREFRIEGRDLLLNGRRVTLRSFQVRNNMHPSSSMAGMAVCRDTIANIKDTGGNFATTHNYDLDPGQTGYGGNLYTAADELGLMLSLTLPHAGSYKWELNQPEIRARYARLSRWLLEQHGNHPSIVLYATSHNTMVYADLNPLKIDGTYTPVDDTVTYMDQKNAKGLAARRWQAFNVLEPLIRDLDPTRAVYHHSAGNAGAMLTHNDYLCWAPPQERAEWHAHWAAEGTKPVFIVEYGLPHTASFTSYRGPHFIYSAAANKNPKWWWDSEYAAAFFNQDAYRITSSKITVLRKHLQNLETKKPSDWGKTKGDITYYDVLALHMRHYLPSFRVQGVSWQLWDMEELWKTDRAAPRLWNPGDRQQSPPANPNVSGPGIRPDFHDLAWQRVYDRPGTTFWTETSATREMRRWSRPQLGYIAGGDPDAAGFTERARNVEAGGTLRKRLLILNDSSRETVCRYEWSLDKTDARGAGTATLEPGAQTRIPVEATLPRNLAAGAYELAARFTFSSGETQTDAFTINVLPPAVPPAVASAHATDGKGGDVVLFDPAGGSARTLTRLGIAHRHYTQANQLPQATDLVARNAVLVIGRKALGAGVRLPQLEATARGLNVLVLEQSAEALTKIGGFRVQTLRPRTAFIRAPGHPALRGLRDAELADWQGGSSLIEDYDNCKDLRVGQNSENWCGFDNARVWRGSNRGAVATVLIEKPSIGDFLPLVDCGFDLQYSPLLEWRGGGEGRAGEGTTRRGGRMILCQLDVTERTRPDPAADRLLRNLVASLKTREIVPAATPAATVAVAARRLVYAGDAEGARLLEELGFEATPYPEAKDLRPGDSILVLGPGASGIVNLDAAVNNGLRVLALGLSKAELVRLWPSRFGDGKNIEERELELGAFLEADALLAPEFAGISNAETHWWAFPRVATLPASPDAIGNEALQRVTIGRGTVVFSQTAPWMFRFEEKPWLRTTWRRSVFLVSRLLHNMGVVAQRTGSPEKLLASGDATRPQPWLKTHYLQTPIQSDDPYIYYRW